MDVYNLSILIVLILCQIMDDKNINSHKSEIWGLCPAADVILG